MSDVAGEQARILVVGTSHDVRTMAARLDDDFDVVFVGNRRDVVERAKRGGLEARYSTLDDGTDLASLDIDADAAVVAFERDRTNLLVTQHLRTRVDVDAVVVRVNDPSREGVISALGVETICPSDLLAPAIRSRLDDSV